MVPGYETDRAYRRNDGRTGGTPTSWPCGMQKEWLKSRPYRRTGAKRRGRYPAQTITRATRSGGSRRGGRS
jgi:hypothetical protein